jgi:hypothetical protein
MWQLLTAASSLENAYTQLLDEFDVEPELLRQNLSDLLGQLADKGSLRIHPRCGISSKDLTPSSPRWHEGATCGANRQLTEIGPTSFAAKPPCGTSAELFLGDVGETREEIFAGKPAAK